jgi:hypothetical protein
MSLQFMIPLLIGKQNTARLMEPKRIKKNIKFLNKTMNLYMGIIKKKINYN